MAPLSKLPSQLFFGSTLLITLIYMIANTINEQEEPVFTVLFIIVLCLGWTVLHAILWIWLAVASSAMAAECAGWAFAIMNIGVVVELIFTSEPPWWRVIIGGVILMHLGIFIGFWRAADFEDSCFFTGAQPPANGAVQTAGTASTGQATSATPAAQSTSSIEDYLPPYEGSEGSKHQETGSTAFRSPV